MADPFSIATGAISLVEVAVKVVKFIDETKKGVSSVDRDLQDLATEIKDLERTSNIIQNAFKNDMKDCNTTQDDPAADSAESWSAVSSTLMDCKITLARMNAALVRVMGESGSSRRDRFKRHRRRLAQDEEMSDLRQRLNKGHQRLQSLLSALSIIVTRQSSLGLSAQMASQERHLRSIGDGSSQGVLTPQEANVHFMIPQSVSNLFVGRKLELLQLKQGLEGRGPVESTTRVVVHGLNGTGKTQLCCKFAQDNRSSFWGVFFVDATNSETVRSTYADIAGRVGIAAKENNVKHWLSVQTKPWLLLVDNADGNPEDLVNKYVPQSRNGTVVFTTTSHSLKKLCDIPIKLGGLEEDISDILLFTSAELPQPVTLATLRTAKDICRKFGSLPLAITRAGAAISNGVCTLENCLETFERNLASVRELIRRQAEPASTAVSDLVYATYEVLIPEAAEEVKEILYFLSFIQSQRFHLQILVKAVLNPQRQINAEKKLKKGDSVLSFKLPPWNRMPFQIVRALHRLLQWRSELPALPCLLHSLRDADPKTVEDKLRDIFARLRDLSLVDHNEEDGTYGMHSSVPWWIRASMVLRDKHIWCEAAHNVLASAILLPPVGAEDDDVQLRKQCLPHIQHARAQQQLLASQREKKQKESNQVTWLNIIPTLGKAQLLRDAKFSMAYAESGMFQESQDLISVVDGHLSKALGLDDPIAAKVRRFLAETYWWLGKPDEAKRLQQELLDACAKGLGEGHVDTLRASEKLGATYWQLGKYHEGRVFADKAVTGYQKLYPSGHVEKSQALTTLGRCFGKLADFDRAVELHEEALHGLKVAEREAKTQYGAQIKDVKENLAMARYDRYRYGHAEKEDLSEAERLADEVLTSHQETHGREHTKSLWAMCNLARIKASAGAVEDAERMIEAGIPVAERTIGIDHVGTLMGKTYFGQILILAGKLKKAESLLSSVVNTYRARDGQEMHGDCLVAASFLLDCYRKLGRHQDKEILEKDVLGGIRRIFGEDSPWERFFVGQHTDMVSTGAEMSEESPVVPLRD